MKAFRFSLQALLTVRQRQEHDALERYAQVLLARRRAEEAVQAVEHELARVASALSARVTAGTVAGEIAQVQAHYLQVDGERKRSVQALSEATAAVAPALQSMIEARRQREVVEQCRDRQRQRHDRERVREEGRLLDELAARRLNSALIWRGHD